MKLCRMDLLILYWRVVLKSRYTVKISLLLYVLTMCCCVPPTQTKQERSPAIPRPSFLLVGEFDSVGRADVTRLVSMFGSTTVDTLMDEVSRVLNVTPSLC